ncbi:MAG: hypothetical protein WC869_12000 [Phycisphaerae bacterium]|jgi:hypothetical protein
MATFVKFQPFVEALAEKVHNLGSDQLVIALSNTAPNATDATLSQITEISYTNLSSRNVTTSTSAQTTGTYKLVLDDLVLTASGSVATFRYVILYNDTSTSDNLVAYWDRGSTVTMASGDTFTVNFDGSAGVLTVA